MCINFVTVHYLNSKSGAYNGIGRTDCEQIRSRIDNNDCRMFRPRRPLSTAFVAETSCNHCY